MSLMQRYSKRRLRAGSLVKGGWLARTLAIGIIWNAVVPCIGAAPAGNSELRISPRSGFYLEPSIVSISAPHSDSRIFFTTTGIIPTPETGQLYVKPIPVNSTMILRAAAFRNGKQSTRVATLTYLFPQAVLKQTGADFPATWGVNEGKPVRADYEMDAEIVNHPAYRDGMAVALKSIPTLSIVMHSADLFDPALGIYSNPKQSGSDWERSASAEWIFGGDAKSIQADCGIRIQGGWNRRPEESPKHSFRLLFKKKYGLAKLEYPLFGPSMAEFDTLILRGGCNNTWLPWSGEERRRGDFIRDQWMRETYGAMGRLSVRGEFVHLYLNGLYWGLYNVAERPSGPFVAANLGGSPEDYDVRNGNHLLEGDGAAWDAMIALANAGLHGSAEYQAMQQWLDIPAFIDYMIVNLYGANADWDRSSNWYAARRRHPEGRFLFFVWDAERTLEQVTDNSLAFDDDQSPPRLFHKLRENAEFRRQFAERVRLHLTNGGALTPERAIERFRTGSDRLDGPILAESARWGDYRRDVHSYKVGPYELYTRDDHWRPEIRRLLGDYFPKRTEAVLRQFQEAGLALWPE